MWKAHNLKPFRVRTFKLSRDPKFVENLRDVVGLYLNPPEHALVLRCDEKSQIQALDRTQPGLPRFHIHFIPTSSSWLNLVERRFREIPDKRIRRGGFQSVRQLIDTIVDYIEQHNDNPKTFVWTAKAEETLDKVARAWDTLDNDSTERTLSRPRRSN